MAWTSGFSAPKLGGSSGQREKSDFYIENQPEKSDFYTPER
jgi:hypothetical protein